MSRSIAIGRVLGGGALGILLGYPIGGIGFQIAGKMLPLLLTFALGTLLLLFLSATFYYSPEMQDSQTISVEQQECSPETNPSYNRPRLVLAVSIGSIFLTTSVMATLEPCLPLWLLKTIELERWHLGAVFVPDSIGYLLTTHFLGGFSYRFGRWRVAMMSMLILGCSCCAVPLASSVFHLTLPHFGIGAGIGAVDAALVPLLATLAENNLSARSQVTTSYGGTFAWGQTAVSLAYFLGPFLGGVLVETFTFPKLMVAMGLLNLFYLPLLVVLIPKRGSERLSETSSLKLVAAKLFSGYTRLANEAIKEESD